MIAERVRGSFRDPSGFVFVAGGTLYRQVNRSFSEEYDACVSSGLYDDLIASGLLVAHRDVRVGFAAAPDAHTVIEPTPIPFISYPYEWSFGQLREAALLTLDVQQRALYRGFVLRDASAYNVQLVDGRPLLIDTLSFERYQEGAPWAAYKAKRRLVREYVAAVAPRTVWDLGGNTGTFSQVAREVADFVVCLDADAAPVELNYREVRARKETGLLPLQMDLMNPSPGNGWAHEERLSLESRGPADLVMALALVHHLAIANNVPLPSLADWLARLGRSLLIEFVPKSDSQVERLLTNRADIFPHYTPEGFERAFDPGWRIEAKERIGDSQRTLYLMRRREG